jgi:hypothetical protein
MVIGTSIVSFSFSFSPRRSKWIGRSVTGSNWTARRMHFFAVPSAICRSMTWVFDVNTSGSRLTLSTWMAMFSSPRE